VLYNCLSWYKFVYTQLHHSRQLYNIHIHGGAKVSDANLMCFDGRRYRVLFARILNSISITFTYKLVVVQYRLSRR